MQGVQGFLTSGRTKLAAYEDYSVLGKCPECRGSLVSAKEEGGGELACSNCGIVVARASSSREDGSSAPSVSKNGPLGSFILAPGSGTPSLNGPALGWARLDANVIGRGGPVLACAQKTERVAERLNLPKSVVQQANLVARKLLPGRKAWGGTIPGISAYSLLYACRSAGIAHVSHRIIQQAYADAGYRIGNSQLMRIGLHSPMGLPRSSVEELVKAVLGKLQSSEKVVASLRKADLDQKEYFARVFELAKEIAAQTGDLTGFNPRTVAAGSVYLASLAVAARTFTQSEAGRALGMAEYTIRDFVCRTRNERPEVMESQVRPVKFGPDLRRT
jgi:transcription initiation factor TFIIIB Brf1 subunit/transcription initiation factor TFIIB